MSQQPSTEPLGEQFIAILSSKGYVPEPETGAFQFFPAEMADLLDDFAKWLGERASAALAQTEPAREVRVEFERETDERWICDISHHPGVMAYGHTPDEALINAVDLLREPRLTQTAEQFAGQMVDCMKNMPGVMGESKLREFLIERLNAFAAHELAAARTEITRLKQFVLAVTASSFCECSHDDDNCCAETEPGACNGCDAAKLLASLGTEREPGESK